MEDYSYKDIPEQDEEKQYNPLRPPPPPPNTGQWANLVITVVVLAVIGVVIFFGLRWVRGIKEAVEATSSGVVEATLTVGTANDGMVQDSATGFPAQELAARPADFKGRWVFTDASIGWLMDEETGDPVTLDEAKAAGGCVYWVEGPLLVKEYRDNPPQRGPGEVMRPYGRVIEVPVDKLGLSAKGLEKLQAMNDYNGSTVSMIIARFVEWP